MDRQTDTDIVLVQRCTVKVEYSSSQTPHRYGNSRVIWDHTVLPATQQRWHSRLYPSLSCRRHIASSCCWGHVLLIRARRPRRATIDQYLMPTGCSTANTPHAAATVNRWDRHKPCCAYYAGSAKKQRWQNSFPPISHPLCSSSSFPFTVSVSKPCPRLSNLHVITENQTFS